MNICSDCPNHTEHQNSWPRNADNQSSDSSDTNSIGHWDNNWQNKKCIACGFRSHTHYNCEKKRKGELYCNRCKRYTHCNTTCSRQRNSSTPRFQHQGHHSPRPDGNYTTPPAEPSYNNYNNYNSRPSPAITHKVLLYLDTSGWVPLANIPSRGNKLPDTCQSIQMVHPVW